MRSMEEFEIGMCCHPRSKFFVHFFQQLYIMLIVALHYGPGFAVSAHGTFPLVDAGMDELLAYA